MVSAPFSEFVKERTPSLQPAYVLHKLKTPQRFDFVRNHSAQTFGPRWPHLRCGPLFARATLDATGLAVPPWFDRWTSCRHAWFRKWPDRGHFLSAAT